MRSRGPHLSPFVFLLFFFFFSSTNPQLDLPPSSSSEANKNATTTMIKVGVMLDLGTPVGKMSRTCIDMSVFDFYAAHSDYSTRLLLHYRNNSNRDVVEAAAAALDLLKNEQVEAIMGPQTSAEAEFVANLGDHAGVPIISFSATSPSLSTSRTPFFVRAAVNDSAQALAIAAVVRAFGWSQVVPIYDDSDYGTGPIPHIVDAVKQHAGARVPHRCVLPRDASDDRISAELNRLMTMQTRVFVVHTTPSLGSRVFARAREAGMMSKGYAWITTSLLGAKSDALLDSMQGVIGVKPYVPKSPAIREFTRRWRRVFLKENPHLDITELSIFGLWAYDAVWALAFAAEQLTGATTGYVDSNSNNKSATDLGTLGTSKTGRKLLESILKVNFEGMSGRFRLINGELHTPAFEIVNVIGETEREVGFWTHQRGLSRHLNLSVGENTGHYSASRGDLAPVIWPGESMAVPKGWETPTSEKKLKIVVPGPVEPGFQSFLRAEWDPETNETKVGGFVIEVFEAALKELPYAVPFEYVTFRPKKTKEGKGVTDYNTLVQQIYSQKYDAFVGDVTITANRSHYVDFTLPYMTSGVSMVVPMRDDHHSNNKAWVFLKPLTGNLWVVSGAFFVFTGAVVWALEHRINPEFRGPPTHQYGTVFYFIFSTLVFAHKEKLVSNLSRVVVIIWVFVVLILTSSYTASLSSMLTVQHLRPTISDFTDLQIRGDFVGYLKNSFTKGLLMNMGFDQHKLKPYKSPQEYLAALAKGNDGGGVAAVIDEIPYLKVFLKDYCSNYTMAGRIYKAGGFGFVFPKGSPLVPDLSRAILDITEGDKMVEIERRWFGDQTNCPNQGSNLSSHSLDFASFWGLFLVTGVASVFSLCIFFLCFFHENRHVWHQTSRDSGGSIWQRVVAMSKHFDQKDLSSHTFRTPPADPNDHDSAAAVNTVASSSPFVHGSESPFSVSNSNMYGGTPPPELATPPLEASPTPSPPEIDISAAAAAATATELPSSVEMIEIRS